MNLHLSARERGELGRREGRPCGSTSTDAVSRFGASPEPPQRGAGLARCHRRGFAVLTRSCALLRFEAGGGRPAGPRRAFEADTELGEQRAGAARPAPETTMRTRWRKSRVAELRAGGRFPRRGTRRPHAAPRGRSGVSRAGTSGRAPRPGASRPLRPASWVTSWNVRSSARKSGSAMPVSASTTAARATPSK